MIGVGEKGMTEAMMKTKAEEPRPPMTLNVTDNDALFLSPPPPVALPLRKPSLLDCASSDEVFPSSL